MQIIDSQVHIWLSGDPPETHRSNLSAEDVIAEMNEAGVDRAILNAVAWDRGPPKADIGGGNRNDYDCNQTTMEAFKRYPDKFGVIYRLRPNAPSQANMFSTLLKKPGVLGTRLIFTGREAPWLLDGTSDWYWPAAEKEQLPTTVRISGGEAIDRIGTIAERHPGLPIVIDHLGTQHRSGGDIGVDLDDAAFAYQKNLLVLAKFPNVAIKATAVTDYSSHAYPHPNIHKYIREIYDQFGPDRMFWDRTFPACAGLTVGV